MTELLSESQQKLLELASKCSVWYEEEKAEREKREKEWQDKLDAIEKAKNESDKKLKDFEDAKTKEDAARYYVLGKLLGRILRTPKISWDDIPY